MNLNTFFQTCVYICICLIVFTLAINLVSATGVFDPVQSGVPVDDSGTAFSDSGFLSGGGLTGMGSIWDVGIIGVGVGSFVLAWATHSVIPIGIYLFSAIFWTSYGNALGVLGNMHIPAEFLLIGTVLMMFFWGAAVVGIFTGSG